MKKIVSFALVLAMVCCLLTVSGCPLSKGQEIRLGTSHLSLKVNKLFVKGEITKEDTDINQVAYYRSDETLVDFDVYQWTKATGETLMDAIQEEVVEFDNAEVHETTVNKIDLVYYYAVEEFDGESYKTVTYIAEDDDNFVELVFWYDGDDAQAVIDEIVGSLHRVKSFRH